MVVARVNLLNTVMMYFYLKETIRIIDVKEWQKSMIQMVFPSILVNMKKMSE